MRYFSVILLMLIGCNQKLKDFKGSDSIYYSSEYKRIEKILSKSTIALNVNYNKNQPYPILLGTTNNRKIKINLKESEYLLSNNESHFIELTELSKSNEQLIHIKTTIDDLDFCEHEIYLPKEIIVKNDFRPNGYIKRTDTVLYWNKDPLNQAGVIVNYTLYDNVFAKNPKEIASGLTIIRDDGEFNLSKILSNKKAKSIDINISRANAISHKFNNDKLVIYFITNDGFPFLEIID